MIYNLLVWKWIDQKSAIKWMYLLCFTFADTALLLCAAELTKNGLTKWELLHQQKCS